MTATRTAPSRGVALGAALALVAGALLGAVYLARPNDAQSAANSTMPNSRAMEAKTGIRILSAHVVADGGIVDVRYLVLDPNKANVIEGDPTHTPALVPASKTDALTKTAAMRKGHERREAGTYFLLYYNRGALVHPGDLIDISFDGDG